MTLHVASAHTRIQTPEIRMFLLCARLRWSAVEESEIRALASLGLDWEKVRQLAERHRTLCLLNLGLTRLGWAGVPGELRAILKDYTARSSARSLHLTAQLMQMIGRLAEKDIPALPFKGPVLGQQVYGGIGLREFLDIDLLVPKKDILKCKRLLNDWGFVSPEKQNGEWEASHIEAQLGLDFTSPDGTVQFEVHWAFIQKWLGFRNDPPDVWKNARTFSFFGQTIKTIRPEDLLPYLCAHAAKHKFSNLFWLVDIAELIRRNPEFHWDAILQEAKDRSNLRCLLLSLKLCSTLLGTPLPREAEESVMRDKMLQPLENQIVGWMFGDSVVPPDGSAEETRFYADVKERWADRLLYRWHLVLLLFRASKADKEFVRLPEVLSFLYLLVRPVRLLLKACKR